MDVRSSLSPLSVEVAEASFQRRRYVDSEMAQNLGANGILACMNGISVMGVAQKLKEEGKLSLPGGVEPRCFDLWHEY